MRTSNPILVVEDLHIRHFVRGVLERFEFDVMDADYASGMNLLEKQSAKISAVITNRPEDFIQSFPDVPILYIASNPDERLASQCAAVLKKPFTYLNLLECLQEILKLRLKLPSGSPRRTLVDMKRIA